MNKQFKTFVKYLLVNYKAHSNLEVDKVIFLKP